MVKGIKISSSFKHRENDLSPIFVTVEGIVIVFSDEHPLKTLFPIINTFEFSAKLIFANDEHPSKAASSIIVILSGISIFFNLTQLANNLVLIVLPIFVNKKFTIS